MTKLRWILVIAIVCLALLATGYRLSQPEPETVAAAPVLPVSSVKVESLAYQATTPDEVEARGLASPVEQRAVFAGEQFGAPISYPTAWERQELSSEVVVFQSPAAETVVRMEAAGPLPADGLARFVDRSLAGEMVLSRQLLTVHGLPAERVITYPDTVDNQVTTFYINTGDTVVVINGTGQQKAIETVARSFNAPQVVAQR